MIINLTKKVTISHKTEYAVRMLQRGRGMIGMTFKDFDAMVFERCHTIHTMFMSIKIDILFITRDNIICAIHKNVSPWRFVVRCKEAYSVIELPPGNIDLTNTEIGDIIDLDTELSESTIKKIQLDDNFLTEIAIPFKESK